MTVTSSWTPHNKNDFGKVQVMHQTSATPNTAENKTSAMLKETGEAELGAVEEEGETEEELPLVCEVEGSPYPVMLPENGPGRAVATAPTPDKAPILC